MFFRNSAISRPALLPLRYSPTWPIVSTTCPTLEADCDFVEYSAPAFTFPQLLKMLRLRNIRWLKLDCEGCEWDMAEDTEFFELLRSSVKLVTTELHPQEAYASEGHYGAVLEFCPTGAVRDALLYALE